MRKTTFLLGAGMGFIVGSRIGRGPYEQLEGAVVKVIHRPDVQDKFGQLVGTAKDQATAVAKKATKAVPSRPASDSTVAPPFNATGPKEEMIDGLLEDGMVATELDHTEDELRRSGDLLEPRAANPRVTGQPASNQPPSS